MRIRARIFGGFSSILVLAVLIAVVGWHALGHFAARVETALAAQTVAGDIEDMVVVAGRFLQNGVRKEDDSAWRAVARVRETAAALARFDGIEHGAVDGMQDSLRISEDTLRAYVGEEETKSRLLDDRRAIIVTLRETAAKMVPIQTARKRAAQDAMAEARALLKRIEAELELTLSAERLVLDLRTAEAAYAVAGGKAERDRLEQAFRQVVPATETLVARLEAPASRPLVDALDGYRAALDDDASHRDTLPSASTTLKAAVEKLRSSGMSRRAGALRGVDEATAELEQAFDLQSASMAADMQANRAETMEARLAADALGDDASAVFDDVAQSMDRSGKTLLLWTVDQSDRATLRALRDRIGGYRQSTRTLIEARARQRDLVRRLDDSMHAAVAAARGVRDTELARIGAGRESARWLLSTGVIVALAIGIALSYWIGRGITLPLARITEVMRRLAAGDKSVEIPGRNRSDELKDVAEAVAIFRENALEMDRLGIEQDRLKQQADAERRDTLLRLADNFDRNIHGVVRSIGAAAEHLQSLAGDLSDSAAGTTRETSAVAVAIGEASINIQTVASASQQLSASITEIARRVADSSRISRLAMEEAARTNRKVDVLAAAAERIGGVVLLIQEIASQTNLLALNATIEAARAGDAGRGFAVVANEVKLLSNQSAAATEEIAGQIQAIQKETREAVDAIHRIANTVLQVNDIAASIAAAVEEQAAATEEISRSVQRVAHGTEEISHSTVNVTSISQEAGQSAAIVLKATGELGVQADTLRRSVEDFIRGIRAA